MSKLELGGKWSPGPCPSHSLSHESADLSCGNFLYPECKIGINILGTNSNFTFDRKIRKGLCDASKSQVKVPETVTPPLGKDSKSEALPSKRH